MNKNAIIESVIGAAKVSPEKFWDHEIKMYVKYAKEFKSASGDERILRKLLELKKWDHLSFRLQHLLKYLSDSLRAKAKIADDWRDGLKKKVSQEVLFEA